MTKYYVLLRKQLKISKWVHNAEAKMNRFKEMTALAFFLFFLLNVSLIRNVLSNS